MILVAIGCGYERGGKEQCEAERLRVLDLAVRLLPVGDMRRVAWLNLDPFSTVWVSSWPTTDCYLSNNELVEIAARYFGLPSPACAALVGEKIVDTTSARSARLSINHRGLAW